MEIVGTALAEMTMPQISPLAGEPIERADAERLAGVLKALADPARLRLLSLIQSATDGEACVCDLTAPLGLSQPTVSHRLRILTEAGLLEREKRGVWAYYRLVPSAIAAIADLLTPPRKRAAKKARGPLRREAPGVTGIMGGVTPGCRPRLLQSTPQDLQE